MTWWHAAALIPALVTYGVFDWAASGVFRKAGRPARRLFVLFAAAAVCQASILLTLVFRSLRPTLVCVGAAIFLLSLLLFAWAVKQQHRIRLSIAYSRDLPEYLLTGGPYRFVRHPCYAAYLLSYVAAVVLTAQPLLVIAVVIMLLVYVDAAAFEERKFGGSQLSDEYKAYRSRTGMLVPRPFARSRRRLESSGAGVV